MQPYLDGHHQMQVKSNILNDTSILKRHWQVQHDSNKVPDEPLKEL